MKPKPERSLIKQSFVWTGSAPKLQWMPPWFPLDRMNREQWCHPPSGCVFVPKALETGWPTAAQRLGARPWDLLRWETINLPPSHPLHCTPLPLCDSRPRGNEVLCGCGGQEGTERAWGECVAHSGLTEQVQIKLLWSLQEQLRLVTGSSVHSG